MTSSSGVGGAPVTGAGNVGETPRDRRYSNLPTSPRTAEDAMGDAVYGYALVEARNHAPDKERGGCICGFCMYSVEHVVAMSVREGWRRRNVRREVTADA